MNLVVSQILKRSVACFASVFLLSVLSEAAKTVSYFNATWTVSEDRPTGVFANGEPWVVGPVTLVSVTPNNNSTWDESFPGEPGPNSGSMRVTVPSTLQGYCTKSKAIPGWDQSKIYVSSLDLSRTANLPAVLLPGEMLMTSTGQAEVGDVRSCINEICVLTVLFEAPPAGSFRPALFSTSPRVVEYNKSDINYSILKNFTPVAATPPRADIEARLPPLPWFEFDTTWLQSSFGPANNFATDGSIRYPSSASGYGREIASKWSAIALWLNTSNTQEIKEKSMIQTIQCGLDIASFIRHGGSFPSDGGHKVGRKFPMLLTGLALNNLEILAMAGDMENPRFSEDQSTFFVQQSDVGRAVNGGLDAQYLQTDVGVAEWGIKHFGYPLADDRRWPEEGGPYYRDVTWPAMVGSVLAIELMGQQAAWNHPAAFAYNERYGNKRGIGSGFEGQMWTRYKRTADGKPNAPQGLKIKR